MTTDGAPEGGRAADLALLLRAAETLLTDITDEQHVLATAVEILGERFGYKGSRGILLYDARTNELVGARGAGRLWEPSDFGGMRLPLGAGITGRSAVERRVLRAEHYKTEVPQGTPLELASIIAVPILSGDELVGVLGIESPEPHAFSERDDEILAAFCRLLALALVNARTNESNAARLRELEAIHEVGQTATTLDREKTLQATVDIFQRIVTSDSCAIYLWSEDEQVLRVAALSFEPASYPADYGEMLRIGRIRPSDGLVGWCARTREAAIIDDVGADPRPRPYVRSNLTGRSAMVVPMIVESRLLGVVRAAKIGTHSFTEDHFRLAKTLAGKAALTLAATEAYEEAKRLSITDDLTGCYNSRYFTLRVSEEMERAKRYGRSLALVMIDSDSLKSVNDRFGHQEGNRHLIDLANAIRSQLRGADMVARFGGDEFLILMPETDLGAAALIADRIRARIRGDLFVATGGMSAVVSVSAGVAAYPATSQTGEELFRQADEALYSAKAAGKDRVAAATYA